MFTCYSIAETYTRLLHAFLDLVSHVTLGKTVPEEVRAKVREQAGEMAALCLILTDQAGCDLLDHKAVERAVNEVKIGEDVDMGSLAEKLPEGLIEEEGA
jgi:hypothetical protein